MNNDMARNTRIERKPDGKVKLVCLECGKTKKVGPNAIDPRCACGAHVNQGFLWPACYTREEVDYWKAILRGEI